MILNLSYGSYLLKRVVNVVYNDSTHEITSTSVGEVEIPSGIGPGVEFYRQNGTGEYWSLRAVDGFPFAEVVHVVISAAEDLSIDSVTITPQIGETLGEVVVVASGTGTLRYKLGSVGPQASDTFSDVPSGTYLLTLSRTEDDYTVTQTVYVDYIDNLEAIATGTDCTAVGTDDGKVTVEVIAGSGDYKVELITESITVEIDLPTTTVNRVNLAPDNYEIKVTDNVTGQVVTIFAAVSYPTVVVVPPTKGTVLKTSVVNSIRFVDRSGSDETHDNRLFCEQTHLGYDKRQYFQKIQKDDKPPIQFFSNFETNVLKLYDYATDELVKAVNVFKTEENIGSTVEYSVLLKEGSAGQTKVLFQSGDLPLPLTVGNVFEIADNVEGMNGKYSIVAILLDETTGFRYLVINLEYLGGGLSSAATCAFDNQLVDYDVFEGLPDFSDVEEGRYYFKIEASDPTDKELVSEPIEVRTEHVGTYKLVYSNEDNAFDVVWATGYRGFLRVPASFFKRLPAGVRTVTRTPSDSLVKLSARKRRVTLFETFQLPPYLHEALSVIFDLDFFSINGVAHQSEDDYAEPSYQEHGRLSDSSIRLEQLNWFSTFNNNKDMASDTSCVCDHLDLVAVSSAPSTIFLNFERKRQRIFKLTEITGDKTVSTLNDALALSFKVIIPVNGSHDIDFGSDFKSSDPRFNGGVFTPELAGTYVAEFAWDGTNWVNDRVSDQVV